MVPLVAPVAQHQPLLVTLRTAQLAHQQIYEIVGVVPFKVYSCIGFGRVNRFRGLPVIVILTNVERREGHPVQRTGGVLFRPFEDAGLAECVRATGWNGHWLVEEARETNGACR